jgi:hypothetical protein
MDAHLYRSKDGLIYDRHMPLVNGAGHPLRRCRLAGGCLGLLVAYQAASLGAQWHI